MQNKGNIFTRMLKGWAEESVKASVVPYNIQGLPEAIYPDHKFIAYVNEGYARNELVYACLNELATSAPEAPYKIYKKSAKGLQEMKNHPIRQLVTNPNPHMSEFEYWEIIILHMYIAGNSFVEKVRSRSGKVVELWPLRPDRIKIYTDGRLVTHYGYTTEQGKEYTIPKEDMIHFKFSNPADNYFGLPPMKAAVRAIASDNEATDYVTAMLQNSAVPPAIITVSERVEEATANRLAAKWKQKYGGKRRGEPVILQAGMDVKTLSNTMRDMEFPDIRTISESRICAVFGVPPILVGANVGLQRSTFSNYGEARKSFWQETVAPLHRRLSDRLTKELAEDFNSENIEGRFDTSRVSALQEVRDAKWDRAIQAYQAGLIKLNEARLEADLDPTDDGDRFYHEPAPQQQPTHPVGGGDEDDKPAQVISE